MTIAATGSPTDSPTTFAATSGTQVITTNGVFIDRSLIINAPGATVQLADALTMGSAKILTLTQGTFDSNNYNVTVGVFDSPLTDTRVLNMGSSIWTLNDTSGDASPWNMGVGTGLTINAGTSQIILIPTTAVYTFNPGGQRYNQVTQATGNTLRFGSGGTYETLDNTVSPTTILFGTSFTNTVNNFNYAGSPGNLVTIGSFTPGVQFTLVKSPSNNETVNYCSISDSIATPFGVWFAPISQGNVDGGNNVGWNFSASGSSGTGMMLFL